MLPYLKENLLKFENSRFEILKIQPINFGGLQQSRKSEVENTNFESFPDAANWKKAAPKGNRTAAVSAKSMTQHFQNLKVLNF